MKNKIRVRIAPSPTGPFHIGTARTALFNYLFAKTTEGDFVLRIEDTDLERSDSKYEKNILEGLKWLGIEADEGPEQGGKYGPYRQSERTSIYEKYLKLLLEGGKAFYCPHSEKELEADKEQQLTQKKAPKHICEARNKNIRKGIIRFKNDATKPIVFEDKIRGKISFDPRLFGDFSIAKNTQTPLYNLAVVIDDETMKISHVIRGEDHIPNTPKQLLLIEALGFKKPEYVHLPLILGPDRSKLSKRHGATSVDDYRRAGYLPEALVNFMALLGWNPGDERELFSKEELIREFSLDKIQKSAAVFDIKKLDWMNGEYIRGKPLWELYVLTKPFLEKSGLLQYSILNKQLSEEDYIRKIIALEQPRLKKLSELPEKIDYFFREPQYDKELLRWKQMQDKEIEKSLERSLAILNEFKKENPTKEEFEKEFFKAIGEGDKGVLLWPLRVALTGKKASPGPFEIMEILGINEVKKRIQIAKEKLFCKF